MPRFTIPQVKNIVSPSWNHIRPKLGFAIIKDIQKIEVQKMKIYRNITELVGRTPLIEIYKDEYNTRIIGKLEAFNPASSVKDRAALAIIEAAEKAGSLQPGGTIIEASSGNTGIALAMVGAARGYRVIITMPESMSMERRALISAYGAELILTPAAEGMAGTVRKAEELLSTTKNAIMADQFANEANYLMHERSTAPEIWEDTDKQVDIFVAGIGTGGTITGVGRFLKRQNQRIQIVGVEPEESALLSRGSAGPHKIQGIGANFVPKILDQEIIDEILPVAGEDAIRTARQLAREKGILVGISAGAAIAATKNLASRTENIGKTIVAVLPDTGERYLSTPLFSE